MKVSVNGRQIFEVSSDRKKVLNKTHEFNDFDKDAPSKFAWILQHKYERCLHRLKLEWLPKLEIRGMTEIPSDDDELCALIFSQTDYKCRRTRENEDGQEELYNHVHGQLRPLHEELMGSTNDLNTMVPLTIEVEGQQALVLSPIRQKVIMNDIHADIFLQDMCRRVHYTQEHPFRHHMKSIKAEWTPKLKARGVNSIPLDDDAFARLIAQDL